MKSEIERIWIANSTIAIITLIFIISLLIGLIFKDTFIILVAGIITMVSVLAVVVYVLIGGD